MPTSAYWLRADLLAALLAEFTLLLAPHVAPGDYASRMSDVSRQLPMVIMSALLALLIVVTQDLARPDRGSIEVSARALQDALAAMPPPPPH